MAAPIATGSARLFRFTGIRQNRTDGAMDIPWRRSAPAIFQRNSRWTGTMPLNPKAQIFNSLVLGRKRLGDSVGLGGRHAQGSRHHHQEQTAKKQDPSPHLSS
jgi:hypothetical protein